MSSALVDALRLAVTAELPAARAFREAIHARPRLSGDESDTADAAAFELSGDTGAGEVVARTGRLLRIGHGAGPAVAIRAEMDALPVVELTGLPFAADPGLQAMHACGHDTHVAGAVALARAVARTPGAPRLLLILQPREEADDAGARDVLDSGLLDSEDVRHVIGVHVQPRLPAGTVGAAPGGVNAATDAFTVTVDGVGGHGAYPHTTADPVLALAATVVALQQVTARRVDPAEGAVATVGTLRAGSAGNVVPDSATATGTLRTISEPTREKLVAAIESITQGVTAAYGCTGRVEFARTVPVLHNDPALAEATQERLHGLGIPVDSRWRSFGSDDFAFYCLQRPSLMLFAGVGRPGLRGGLHSARFDPGPASVDLVARSFLAGYLAASGLPPA